MTWPSGQKYDGMHKANKKHGQATYTMTNGDTDTGNWKDDARHGVFNLVKSGVKKKYEYDQNKFVKEIAL